MNENFNLRESIFLSNNDIKIDNDNFYNYTINLDINRYDNSEIKDLYFFENNGKLEEFKNIDNNFIKIGLLSNNKSIKTKFLQKLIFEMKNYNETINTKIKYLNEKNLSKEIKELREKFNENNKIIDLITKNEKNNFKEVCELLVYENKNLDEKIKNIEREEKEKQKLLNQSKKFELEIKDVNTPIGLNIKYFENDDNKKIKKYLFADCKSFSYLFSLFSSLNYENLNSIKLLNYKINQKLIFNYIIKNFNIIIYFTGINNKIDDKFINKLIKNLSKNQILIIIHNLYLFNKESFENYIKINFKKFIKKIIDNENNIFFYIQKINNLNIIHIPFGNESSEKFKKNNFFVYSYLARLIINSFLVESNEKKLFDEIKICCNDYLNKLKKNIKYNNFIQENKIFVPKSFYSFDEKNFNICLEISDLQDLKINIILKKNYYLISISGIKDSNKNRENNEMIQMCLKKMQNGNFLKQIKIFYSKILLTNNEFSVYKNENDGIIRINNIIHK